MRLKADFRMSTDWLIKDYRNIFMALIKSAINNFDPILLNSLYGTNEQKMKINKPFTFFIQFPEYKGINEGKILCGNKFSIYFSTNDEKLIIAFYNGLLQKNTFVIGENYPIAFSLDRLQLLPFKRITIGKVKFRTIAPILVNETGSNLYLSPTMPKFSDAFKLIISTQAKNFNINCPETLISFEINSMKKLCLSHYNQTMTSWLGEFVLEAPANVLQLVYDIGIGVRRSQGFGMLDIVKTY